MSVDHWRTTIRLPLDASLSDRQAARYVRSIDAKLLLFLRRVRCIELEIGVGDSSMATDSVQPSKTVLRRIDHGKIGHGKIGDASDADDDIVDTHKHANTNFVAVNDGESVSTDTSGGNTQAELVELLHGKLSQSFAVLRELFPVPAGLERNGVAIERTEIAMAFQIVPQCASNDDGFAYEPLPAQDCYAFLPLRSFGLRFVLHADFLVPSSREDIVASSEWNRFLRSCVPALYASAFAVLRDEDQLTSVCFYGTLPLPGDVHRSFMQPLAESILTHMQSITCVRTTDNGWCYPTNARRLPSALADADKLAIEQLFGAKKIELHSGDVRLLDENFAIATGLGPSQCSALGVRTLDVNDLCCCVVAAAKKWECGELDDKQFGELFRRVTALAWRVAMAPGGGGGAALARAMSASAVLPLAAQTGRRQCIALDKCSCDMVVLEPEQALPILDVCNDLLARIDHRVLLDGRNGADAITVQRLLRDMGVSEFDASRFATNVVLPRLLLLSNESGAGTPAESTADAAVDNGEVASMFSDEQLVAMLRFLRDSCVPVSPGVAARIMLPVRRESGDSFVSSPDNSSRARVCACNAVLGADFVPELADLDLLVRAHASNAAASSDASHSAVPPTNATFAVCGATILANGDSDDRRRWMEFLVCKLGVQVQLSLSTVENNQCNGVNVQYASLATSPWAALARGSDEGAAESALFVERDFRSCALERAVGAVETAVTLGTGAHAGAVLWRALCACAPLWPSDWSRARVRSSRALLGPEVPSSVALLLQRASWVPTNIRAPPAENSDVGDTRISNTANVHAVWCVRPSLVCADAKAAADFGVPTPAFDTSVASSGALMNALGMLRDVDNNPLALCEVACKVWPTALASNADFLSPDVARRAYLCIAGDTAAVNYATRNGLCIFVLAKHPQSLGELVPTLCSRNEVVWHDSTGLVSKYGLLQCAEDAYSCVADPELDFKFKTALMRLGVAHEPVWTTWAKVLDRIRGKSLAFTSAQKDEPSASELAADAARALAAAAGAFKPVRERPLLGGEDSIDNTWVPVLNVNAYVPCELNSSGAIVWCTVRQALLADVPSLAAHFRDKLVTARDGANGADASAKGSAHVGTNASCAQTSSRESSAPSSGSGSGAGKHDHLAFVHPTVQKDGNAMRLLRACGLRSLSSCVESDVQNRGGLLTGWRAGERAVNDALRAARANLDSIGASSVTQSECARHAERFAQAQLAFVRELPVIHRLVVDGVDLAIAEAPKLLAWDGNLLVVARGAINARGILTMPAIEQLAEFVAQGPSVRTLAKLVNSDLQSGGANSNDIGVASGADGENGLPMNTSSATGTEWRIPAAPQESHQVDWLDLLQDKGKSDTSEDSIAVGNDESESDNTATAALWENAEGNRLLGLANQINGNEHDNDDGGLWEAREVTHRPAKKNVATNETSEVVSRVIRDANDGFVVENTNREQAAANSGGGSATQDASARANHVADLVQRGASANAQLGREGASTTTGVRDGGARSGERERVGDNNGSVCNGAGGDGGVGDGSASTSTGTGAVTGGAGLHTDLQIEPSVVEAMRVKSLFEASGDSTIAVSREAVTTTAVAAADRRAQRSAVASAAGESEAASTAGGSSNNEAAALVAIAALKAGDSTAAMATGRAGEAIVAAHLRRKFGAERVLWLNEESEQALPFDIVVWREEAVEKRQSQTPANMATPVFAKSADVWRFIEVKTTRDRASAGVFHWSAQEVACALDAGGRYELWRVVVDSAVHDGVAQPRLDVFVVADVGSAFVRHQLALFGHCDRLVEELKTN